MHRVVDVNASTSSRNAHLRGPEADAGPAAGHEPDGVSVGPALDDGEAQNAGIELLRRLEIDDLEDELADA